MATGPHRWLPPWCQRRQWRVCVFCFHCLPPTCCGLFWLGTRAAAPGPDSWGRGEAAGGRKQAGALQTPSSPGRGAGPGSSRNSTGPRAMLPPGGAAQTVGSSGCHSLITQPAVLREYRRRIMDSAFMPPSPPQITPPQNCNNGGHMKQADLSSYILQLLEERAGSAGALDAPALPPTARGTGPGPAGRWMPVLFVNCGL